MTMTSLLYSDEAVCREGVTMKPIRYLVLIILIACCALIVAGQAPQTDADLRKAAQDGDMQAVKDLLDKGANVNAKDDTGKTVLHWVAPARQS